MKKLNKILLPILLIAVLVFTGTGIHQMVKADPPVLRILTLCDSITASGNYQTEMSRILTLNGVSHQFFNGAVGGTGVEYWSTHVTAVMNTYQPDLVLLNCGTNDTWTVNHSVSEFNAYYRTTVEAILNWRTPNRVKLGVAYIQYGTAPADATMLSRMPAVNDAIASQLGYYGSFITGVADFQVIPANGLYQDSSGYHPTTRGYNAMGRIWYDSLQSAMGWSVNSEPALCGLDGVRQQAGYTRPTPVACTGQ